MARRQEQEPASEEVTEAAPGVLRMQLPVFLPGLGHVNCYAIVDRKGAALVDPGLPGPRTWRALQERLQRAGLALKHVHTVLVTHSHFDHFGGASRLARETGAEIVAHRSFALGATAQPPPGREFSVDDLAAQEEEAKEQPFARVDVPPVALARRSTRELPWGAQRPRPPLRTRLRFAAMRWFSRTSFAPRISRTIEHGDVLDLADREWFVVHTPGHTADHFCLHDPEHGTFVSGDHVLPTITPHISGISSSPDPLASFFYSLDRVAEIGGVRQVLPAHGHPFADLRKRTEAIKRHHHERLETVRQISRELGPATVQAFSQRLFQQRSWGPMAESETYAHLEHLRHAGRAECFRRSGQLLYVIG